MGPSVEFVSAIIGAFSNKKNGGQFSSPKKDQDQIRDATYISEQWPSYSEDSGPSGYF